LQCSETGGKGPLQTAVQRHYRRDRAVIAGVRLGKRRRELNQRQRVPLCSVQHPSTHGRAERRVTAGEQRTRFFLVKREKVMLFEPAALEEPFLTGPDRTDQGDRTAFDPSRDRAEDAGGRPVQPLRARCG
jgi:hypothetical protein